MTPLVSHTARLFVFSLVVVLSAGLSGAEPAKSSSTVLGVQNTQFTKNGEPVFLLGISYYAGTGASDEFVRRDLDEMRRHGFNWVRVWATWDGFDRNISAVDADGGPRQPYLDRLKSIVAECDRRGMIVDVTLTRGDTPGLIHNLQAHQQAVETIVETLNEHRNWYLDLANEHDVGDARHVSDEELKMLRELVRRLDADRLVTASFGGHDLTEDDLRKSLRTVGADFLTPHRPREPESPGQTAAKTVETLELLQAIGRSVPVHYQEPFRRGYGSWQPTADDYLTDLSGAIDGGAAGWCLHNGSQRNDDDERPRRSFDLREQRLFDQLDEVERAVVEQASHVVESRTAEVR